MWKIFVLLNILIIGSKSHEYQQLINYNNALSFNKKLVENKFVNVDLCEADLQSIDQALDSNEPWAVELVDTWAKIQAGYLSGNNFNIGDFDRCVRFQHQLSTNRIVQGQHCLVVLSALPNSTLNNERNDISLKHVANFFRKNRIIATNGFCMPQTCSATRIVQFLNQKFLFSNDLIAHGAECRDLSITFDALDYFAISLFSIIALLVMFSTMYDIIKSKSQHSEPNKLLTSFSFYTNGYKLFDVTKLKSSNSLNCLHGLRAMSVFWIMLGHRVTNQFPWGNPNDFLEFMRTQTVLASIISGNTLAVDTFFVMGALLMTWSTLKDCDRNELNILRMIWKRYIRYTVVYAALILAVISFSKLALRGPLYFDSLRQTCVDNWWFTLLHIQNYLPSDEMCLNHGWYLSADFQLFLISPFIVWLIQKYGKKLLAVPVILCLATLAYLISISIVFEIKFAKRAVSADYLKYIYYVTHSRCGPWFIGMVLGYFLYNYRGRKFNVNKYLNAFMWTTCLSTLAAVVILQFPITYPSEPLSQAIHVSYLSLSRNLWAVAICWIIFACQNLKTGGIIRWFLSLPQWQPISRIGLSMYLVGPIYQVIMILNQRVPLYMTFWQFIPVYLSDVIIISMMSVISYLVFEAPPLIIEDYIYKRIKNKTT